MPPASRHGLHLLRLDELPFEVLALRDVEHDTDDFASHPRARRAGSPLVEHPR